MDAFLTALTKRISDRWLTSVVIPGLFFTVAVACISYLGHAHALDLTLLQHQLETAVSTAKPPARGGLILVWLLSAVIAVALAAHTAGRIIERIWLGQWNGPVARALTTRRRHLAIRSMADSRPGDPYLPARPTWIGDRIRLAEARIRAQYGLEITLAWPRLWLLLDSNNREPVREARDRFDAACRLAGWAILYAVLAAGWWPAAAIAIPTFFMAWLRARNAIAIFADLVEAAADIHQNTLAEALGVKLPDGRITHAQAADINASLYKGYTAPPPTLRWWRNPPTPPPTQSARPGNPS